jgi:hypothetical protein
VDWKSSKVLNSGWIAELKSNYDVNYQFPELQHFVLCSSDYVIEVLAESEPLIREWTVPKEKEPTHEGSEYELVIPEPTFFNAQSDESSFFRTLKELPEVARVTGYSKGTLAEPNDIVLSLSCKYLSNESLRSVIGLLRRYGVSMSSLAPQLGPHNRGWFDDIENYWHEGVFGQSADERPD